MAVNAYKNGIMSRGILMDIPALKGVKYLEPSTPVYPADLDAWEKKAGVKVGTGRHRLHTDRPVGQAGGERPMEHRGGSGGMHPSCARWFQPAGRGDGGQRHTRRIDAFAGSGRWLPIHQLLLIAMGTPLFDNCDLEALSQAAAARHRWEFH